MISTQRGFSPQQRAIISGGIRDRGAAVASILVPRRDVIALPTNMSTGDGLRAVIAAGHSRAPVVGPRGLDDVSSGPSTTVAGLVLPGSVTSRPPSTRSTDAPSPESGCARKPIPQLSRRAGDLLHSNATAVAMARAPTSTGGQRTFPLRWRLPPGTGMLGQQEMLGR